MGLWIMLGSGKDLRLPAKPPETHGHGLEPGQPGLSVTPAGLLGTTSPDLVSGFPQTTQNNPLVLDMVKNERDASTTCSMFLK